MDFKPEEYGVGLSLFCNLASEGLDIIMHQLKFVYSSPFKDSHSHPIHTCFAMIASNVYLNYTVNLFICSLSRLSWGPQRI